MQSTFRKFFKRRCASIATLALIGTLSFSAYAVEPFTLQDIRVEGLKHADSGTVFANIPFRIGDVYDDDKGTTAIQSLYATGLFNDVRLSTHNGVLVIAVQERSSIASLTFTGTKAFDSKTLITALKGIGIAEGRPFDKALADQAEQEIKRQYLGMSFYSVDVQVTTTPIDNNRVNVHFAVTEGDVAKIKEIRIIGNHDVSTSRLRKEMSLTSGGWLSWYTKNNRYSREKLNADLEKIRSYYLNRGYLDFVINSTQVEISPNKQDIALIIDLSEGPQYILSSVELEGDYLERDNEFKAVIDLNVGKPYNASQVADVVKKFSDIYGSYGYAFAQIQPQPVMDKENGTVALRIVSRPQRRVYVRRVHIRGNDKTRDEVIRREFRQFESAWYDWSKIQLSRDRVDRLGFFTEVNMDTSPVPNSDDQVDVTIEVKEKPTGSLSLGAGFSSDDKISINAGISQENVFGSGNYLGLGVSSSKYNRQFRVSTLNPYFSQDGVSRGFDVYYTTTRPYSSSSSHEYYSIETAGASFRFGVPFTEVDKVYFGFGGETTRIKPGRELPGAYAEYIGKYGERATYFPLTIGWSRDSRDSTLVPTKGTFHRVNGELSLLGDTHYSKATYQYQRWVPLSSEYTLALNGEIGWGRGIGSKDYPVFKNFYGGGQGFVRGFESGTFGRYDSATDTYSGGSKSYNINLELYAPFPGSGQDRTLRLSAFADYGNVTADYEMRRVGGVLVRSKRSGFQFGDARASVGIGFSWISPLGPLKFSYAIPIQENDDDKIERFQFQIGTSF